MTSPTKLLFMAVVLGVLLLVACKHSQQTTTAAESSASMPIRDANVPLQRVPFTINEGSYFVGNDFSAPANGAFLLMRTEAAFSAIFHPATVMGGKQVFLQPSDFQAKDAIALVYSPAGNGYYDLSVTSVAFGRDTLFVTFSSTPGADERTYAGNSYILATIPKQACKVVAFAENGKYVKMEKVQ